METRRGAKSPASIDIETKRGMDERSEGRSYCSILKDRTFPESWIPGIEILQDRINLQKQREKAKPHGGVAQLGEHLPCKQGVRGSIPLISTKSGRRTRERSTEPKLDGLVAQLARARD